MNPIEFPFGVKINAGFFFSGDVHTFRTDQISQRMMCWEHGTIAKHVLLSIKMSSDQQKPTALNLPLYSCIYLPVYQGFTIIYMDHMDIHTPSCNNAHDHDPMIGMLNCWGKFFLDKLLFSKLIFKNMSLPFMSILTLSFINLRQILTAFPQNKVCPKIFITRYLWLRWRMK